MKRITFVLIAGAIVASVIVSTAVGTGHAQQDGAPVFVTTIPAGYRDWRLVSVAHEEGNLNDIRAILGNDVAIDAYRKEKLPFPEGAIIGRIAWRHVPSEENNKVFGREQSFVPGEAPPCTCSLWSKTQRNTPQRADGDTLNSIRTANQGPSQI